MLSSARRPALRAALRRWRAPMSLGVGLPLLLGSTPAAAAGAGGIVLGGVTTWIGMFAALLLGRVGETGRVVLGDINAAMLRAGRDRMLNAGFVRNLDYAQVNAQALAFPDASFDAVTIAFGLRNVTDKNAALREMHRVLRAGGRALILEFSTVRSALLKPIYDFHSFEVLPRLGAFIADDAESYRYLAESIRKHPDQATLKAMMETAGFARVDVRNLTAGIVAIHRGYKF